MKWPEATFGCCAAICTVLFFIVIIGSSKTPEYYKLKAYEAYASAARKAGQVPEPPCDCQQIQVPSEVER